MEKLDNVTQEEWFSFWVKEAIEHKFILEYTAEKDITAFKLFDGLDYEYTVDKVLYPGTARAKIKTITKKDTLLYPMSYTPDGIIIWNPKVKNILFNDLFEKGSAYFKAQFIQEKWVTFLDVKAPKGVNRAADLPFSFTRKFMWEKLNIYVNKVMIVPPKPSDKGYIFKDTWTPARYFFTDKLTKERSLTYKAINIDKFKKLNNLNKKL